jgi:ABC-type sugar transport system ATPase subunit
MCWESTVAASSEVEPGPDGRAGTADPALALDMRGIRKGFAGTLALDDVAFDVRFGEIHGLVGQNGAGKSTLMKILAGDQVADAGEIFVTGQPVRFRTPRDARAAGIGIVYQELSLLGNLTVAENVALGHERSRAGFIDDRAAKAEAADALMRMNLEYIDPGTDVGTLSLAEQQLVEIAKALHDEAKILVFDEPTAALTVQDTDRLLTTMRELREAGVAIIFISHRYREVIDVCDRCTVMRNGRVVAKESMDGMSVHRLAELTLGTQAAAAVKPMMQHVPGPANDASAPALEADGLAVGDKVRDVSFEVAGGEVIGLCGLLGSGQNEVARALYGDLALRSGQIRMDGQDVSFRSPHQAARHGIGFLSESRRDEGIFPHQTTRSNMTVASLRTLWSGFPIISRRRELALSDEVADRVGVAPAARERRIELLSGGNQQKALVGRWLMRGARVLICIEPTRGVDVGARVEIYEQLRALAVAGAGLIIVTTDIEEALTLCDRVIVIYEGAVVASMRTSESTERDVFVAMQGVVPEPNAAGRA